MVDDSAGMKISRILDRTVVTLRREDSERKTTPPREGETEEANEMVDLELEREGVGRKKEEETAIVAP